MRQKHLTILVPNGENNLSSIVGAYKIFSRANDYYKQQHGKDVFMIALAGTADEVAFHGGLFSARPHLRLQDIYKTDLVIVPSLNHNYHDSVSENGVSIEWIKSQYRSGACVASICTGAFLLAASGLLSGKSCSTHWAAAAELQRLYPDVNVGTEKLITDENGICTNGGAYSFLNLILYLVEKYYDRDTAVYCSKVFQVEIDRQSQSEFIIFQGQHSHDDELIRQAQTYLEKEATGKISIEKLADDFAIGRRSFDRRFIKATGNTPGEYLQRVRIEAAKKAFERSRKTVNEVMYDVGYADQKAFREVFRKFTGLSPLDYRNRYNKAVNLTARSN